MDAAQTTIETTFDAVRPTPTEAPTVATELFVSDVHGEYEAFAHLMRGGCGDVRAIADQVAGEADGPALATLVCYPEQVLDRELGAAPDPQAWLAAKTGQMLAMLHALARIRTTDELRDAYPAGDLGASIARLVERSANSAAGPNAADPDPEVAAFLASLDPDADRLLVVALAETIQRLAVGAVHMVGDVYDRGPAPDLVVDELERWPKLDVQWGNHDMLWMGAALGQPGCVANAVRICARYGNLSILRDTYGIDIAPLEQFARTAYADDPCAAFGCKGGADMSPEERDLTVKVQKAMAIIQFKVEARLIAENPSFGLEARNLLDKVDYEAGTVVIDGTTHELLDTVFPTVDPADPFRMTPAEEQVMDHLAAAFRSCERLQRHIGLFLEKGSLYKVDGDALLFHACVPLNADGTCKEVEIFGRTLEGKALFDAVEGYVRDAFTATDPVARKQGMDFLWYLWLGEGSPLFAKSKMATFELYYVADKAARKEVKNPFYSLLDDETVIAGIFEEFGMDPATSRIVCGHVPIKVKDGEDPVRCGGKVLMIDGGMSRAYQSTTGLGGLALRHDARGWALAYLDPFRGTDQAIATAADLTMRWREV